MMMHPIGPQLVLDLSLLFLLSAEAFHFIPSIHFVISSTSGMFVFLTVSSSTGDFPACLATEKMKTKSYNPQVLFYRNPIWVSWPSTHHSIFYWHTTCGRDPPEKLSMSGQVRVHYLQASRHTYLLNTTKLVAVSVSLLHNFMKLFLLLSAALCLPSRLLSEKKCLDIL